MATFANLVLPIIDHGDLSATYDMNWYPLPEERIYKKTEQIFWALGWCSGSADNGATPKPDNLNLPPSTCMAEGRLASCMLSNDLHKCFGEDLPPQNICKNKWFLN